MTKGSKTAIKPASDALCCLTYWIFANMAVLNCAAFFSKPMPFISSSISFVSISVLMSGCNASWWFSFESPYPDALKWSHPPLYLYCLHILIGEALWGPQIHHQSLHLHLFTAMEMVMYFFQQHFFFPTFYSLFWHFPTWSDIFQLIISNDFIGQNT